MLMPKSDFNVDELVHDESFRAWTEGRANHEDKVYWDSWVQQSNKNRRLARRAQSEIIGFTFLSVTKPQANRAWKRLKRGLEGSYTRYPKLTAQPKRRPWLYYGIAAGIVIIITAGAIGLFLFYNNPGGKVQLASKWKTVHTDYGKRKKITFSRGASITINGHSTLAYMVGPAAGRRIQVKLQGEAYFSNPQNNGPGSAFWVKTSDGEITDVGTQFVVSTRGGHTQVVLKRGKVRIDQKDGLDSEPVQLHPNQMAIFSKDSSGITIKQVNAAVYTSWTTSKLKFDHTPLIVIAKRLEYNYGKPIVICGSRLAHQSLSGAVKNIGLPVIVAAVAKALHTKYFIKVDTVYFGRNCGG